MAWLSLLVGDVVAQDGSKESGLVIGDRYLTWWFKTLLILFMLVFGRLFYKFRVKPIKKLSWKWRQGTRAGGLKIEQDKFLLDERAEKLEQQNKQKALFYSDLSHDLRTSLTMIEGPLELIIDKTQDREITQLAICGLKNSRLALKLTKQLIDLGRQEHMGKQEHIEYFVKWELMDVVAFVEGMTLSFENTARRQDIVLSFSSTENTLSMDCDADKLEKIIYNLLSNAIKFTPPGGTIKVGIRLTNDICSILVSDNGTGISERDQRHIFNRYFQVGSKKNGGGIGLSIVRDLVTILDGDISLESELGSGTVFQVDLPYKPIPTNGSSVVNSMPHELPSAMQFLQCTANDTEQYDDYLHKPFNSQELFLKVKNILAHQENIAAFYGRSGSNSPVNETTAALNPKERHFLNEVDSQIQANLSDGFFGVSELSQQMCMSRKNLHRKLKALTGQSPSTFIRIARLKASLALLQSGKYNVSEISFLVGFNSPTYFSKCFQEYYGFLAKNVSVEG